MIQFFEQQQPQQTNRVEPLFYFKFEMRLQFIPFIEQQIKEFIAFSEEKINLAEHVPQILVILNKRIRDIDRFYDQNWNDYRTQQILRSRQFLLEFCKQNHAKLSQNKQPNKSKMQQDIAKSKASPTPNRSKAQIGNKFDKTISPIQNKKQHKEVVKGDKLKESSIIKNRGLVVQEIKHSASKSMSKEKGKIMTPIQSKGSKLASPMLQSPILKKLPLSKEKDSQSPNKTKKMQSSKQKKIQPTKKLTKEQYIEYLRKKARQ